MLLGLLLVFLIHRIRVVFPMVEDALQLAFFIERIDKMTIDNVRAEVPRTAESMHEVGLVSIEEVESIGQ